MKKILSLLALTMLCITGANAETVKYALAEGDTFTSGQTVEVKNDAGAVVATITYGESGGADFQAAGANGSVEGYTAFTAGNGTNGNKEGGTFYTITPKVDGTISVAVVLNADKSFYIEENGTALDAYNGITVASKYYGTYEFDAKASKAYKVYCAGSKLGFYGFELTVAEEAGVASKAIYLIPNVWDAKDATERYAVWAWNGELGKWIDFEEFHGVYALAVPTTMDGITIVRMNGETTEDNWDNKWNQTADIDFTQIADNTVFTITDWDSNYETRPFQSLLDEAKAYMAIFDRQAAAALTPYFNNLETEINKEEKSFNAIRNAVSMLVAKADPFIKIGIQKVKEYAVDIDEEVIDNDIEVIEAAYTAKNFAKLIAGLKAYEEDFVAASGRYVEKARTIANDNAGKEGVDALNTAIAAVDAQLAADPIQIMELGYAVRNLVLAMRAFMENVEGIIPDGTYYVMNANDGTLINAEGALDAKGAPITFTFDKANNVYTIAGADFFSGKQWTVAEAIEGMSGYYTISTAEGFLAANATALEQIADGTADAAIWILLEKAYWEDIVNSTYTVAGTANLTGTENDWDIAETNQMVLNEETGLYEKKFKRIAINAENQPEFKVVQTNMEGENIWYPENNWVITTDYVGGEGIYDITITFDPSDFKEVGVIVEERIVFPEDAIVYDFEAAADAGENPANKNGSAANGQAFYGWENPEKTDSKRQDYKGYEWAEGSVLPEECHVWRRSDRINGNVADNDGLKCPSNKEMAIDGLKAGDKVIIVYDAEGATDKEIIWAIGDGTSEGGPGHVRTTATIDGVEAVTGQTTIASGAEIVVNSVTPAENGSGYIVFQVKKGMVIKQIAVVPAPEETLYVIGDANGWDRTNMEELTYDETDGYKYEIVTDKDFYFAFANKQMTTEEAEADADWAIFNSTYRYAIGEGDQTASLDTEYQLQQVNGTIKLAAGKYNVYVTKDLKMTIKDATTDGINTVKTVAEDAVIYNLAGQKVMKAQKGLYIVNGKKVILK